MNRSKPFIREASQEELTAWLNRRGYPGWRAKQIRRWLYKEWIADFSAMSNLPREMRRDLADSFSGESVECRKTEVSRDSTRKFLFQLSDAELVETVLMPTEKRLTVCVSTQAGCPVGCRFCATGRNGFRRNLEVAEIIDQVLYCCRYMNRKITNLVVMGMGEPLLNFDSTVKALRLLNDAELLDLSARGVTVSTSGIPEGIRKLAEMKAQWNLAWSLHSPDEQCRSRLIPDHHRYSIQEISDACLYYRLLTGRRVTIEYTLMAGCNDSREDAERVARLAAEIKAKVNLIGYNPAAPDYRRSLESSSLSFLKRLRRLGVTATVRRGRGQDIQAACGQLRGGYQNQPD